MASHHRHRWRQVRRAGRSLRKGWDTSRWWAQDVFGSLAADRRRFGWSVVAAIALVATLLFSWEAFRAVASLKEADATAEVLKTDIVNGDVDAARLALSEFVDDTSRAENSTNGPVWWLAARIPVLGRNVQAMRIVSREIDHVADDVLPGVVDVADKVRLETFRPSNGRVDLAAVGDAAPILATADNVMTKANREIADIDVESLLPLLREPMRGLQAQFDRTATAASAADDAARLLPPMIGAGGKKRVYLLLILNNAEVRSLGGMPGSFAELNAKDGKLSMGRQGGISDLYPVAKPPIRLTRDEKLVFPSAIAGDVRDAAIHPDFPRAAELAAAAATERWKRKYDGVIAVDPVAMSYMLNGIGEVAVGDGMVINASNAVATLLNGVYLKYPTDQNKQDDVFEAAARRIFDATVDGTGDSVLVIRALVRGVTERRVMLWSRNASEQRRIETSGVANLLPRGVDPPQVGVYVSGNGSAKMTYYLGMGTTLRSTACLDGDAQQLRTTTTLVSNAPSNARRLPISIVGFGPYVTEGNIKVGLMVVGPENGTIESMVVDGKSAPTGAAKLLGRPVAKVSRELPPGSSSVIVTTMSTPKSASSDPELRTTPGILRNDDSVGASACR